MTESSQSLVESIYVEKVAGQKDEILYTDTLININKVGLDLVVKFKK